MEKFGMEALEYVDKIAEHGITEMAKAMEVIIRTIRNMLDYVTNDNLADLANKKIFEHLVKFDEIVKRTGGIYTRKEIHAFAENALNRVIRDLESQGPISLRSLSLYYDYKKKDVQSHTRRMRM